MINLDNVKRMSKKQIVILAGYKNIKGLCKSNPLLCKNGKAPSRKQLIKEMF